MPRRTHGDLAPVSQPREEQTLSVRPKLVKRRVECRPHARGFEIYDDQVQQTFPNGLLNRGVAFIFHAVNSRPAHLHVRVSFAVEKGSPCCTHGIPISKHGQNHHIPVPGRPQGIRPARHSLGLGLMKGHVTFYSFRPPERFIFFRLALRKISKSPGRDLR